MSQRWKNLEKYIEQKKQTKDKNYAYSHASEIIDKVESVNQSVIGKNNDKNVEHEKEI